MIISTFRWRRHFKTITLLVIFSVLLIFFVIKRYEISNLIVYTTTTDPNYKTILYWNNFFGDEEFYLGTGFLAQNCPVYKKCFATHSRFIKNVDEFDAILFHGLYPYVDLNDLPNKRKPEQVYIFVSNEIPLFRHAERMPYNNFYNLTMTHHFDSDVIWSYGNIVERDNESSVLAPSKSQIKWKTEPARKYDQYMEENQLNAIIMGKKNLAIWYRSHCYTDGKREMYIAELEKHMDVTSHGKCSTIGCSMGRNCLKEVVEPRYFFYLAFENSLCDDYVTEKFFHALRVSVVPVVYGGANYSRFAPYKSYIDALDFDTPKELADYLIKLSKDPIEYKKYFDWKRRYRSISPRQRIICDLCEVLHSKRKKKTYNIMQWYSANLCTVQKKLYKQVLGGGLLYATKKTLQS